VLANGWERATVERPGTEQTVGSETMQKPKKIQIAYRTGWAQPAYT
jgi:hypothetical protein